MRTVITGGAGFLASHLCDALLERDHEVICIDNLITGDTRNIAHLMGNDAFHFIKYDVTDYIYVDGPVDLVLHFASPASPADYLRYPIETLKVGSLGTHKTLGLAHHKGARYVLASSSEVYGDPQVHPQREDYWGSVNPVGYRGVYDEAKRFAEAMAMAYRRSNDTDVRIARLFNTFGPRMRLDDGRAIPNFMCQAIRGDDITVFGNGEQTRSFTYIEDTVAGLCRLMEVNRDALGEMPVFNIGNPAEVKLIDIARETVEVTGSSSQIITQPFPTGYEDDPKVRQPDISRAKKHLGWQPKVDRLAGLQTTAAYFRTRLEELGQA
jgi:dTDP-glucose 4,6-dehydratase